MSCTCSAIIWRRSSSVSNRSRTWPRCPKEEGRRSATCLSDRLLGSPSLSWEGGKLNPEPSQPPDGSLRRPSSMPISSDATRHPGGGGTRIPLPAVSQCPAAQESLSAQHSLVSSPLHDYSDNEYNKNILPHATHATHATHTPTFVFSRLSATCDRLQAWETPSTAPYPQLSSRRSQRRYCCPAGRPRQHPFRRNSTPG